MTATESLLPEIINDFFNKIGTKRTCQVRTIMSRLARQTGNHLNLLSISADDPLGTRSEDPYRNLFR